MDTFVKANSIVREIWGKGDTILFIFAGAAAEFALNKAVDWLYFTGRLPADPLGRLFSTVGYAQQIVFSDKAEALQSIDRMRSIHAGVEASRGATIPDWAYRDVLFMLVYYSISAFELLERRLTATEKEEVYRVFYQVGTRMGIPDLPPNYQAWLPIRESHLQQDLQNSHLTTDLFKQYQKHLGLIRYKILIEAQVLVLPPVVNKLLGFRSICMLTPVLPIYKSLRKLRLDGFLKSMLFPPAYKAKILALDK